jgi:huntingtin-interacting protein 1-related protein
LITKSISSINKVIDLSYETISELLDLAEKIDGFQKIVFQNLRPGINNECRIAALVPLVEESHGIYQFLTFMLTAMHQIVGSIEVLAPLRQRYNLCHYALFKFYHECSTIRFLTTLITIPKLNQNPPDLLAKGPLKQPKQASKASPNALANVDVSEQERVE